MFWGEGIHFLACVGWGFQNGSYVIHAISDVINKRTQVAIDCVHALWVIITQCVKNEAELSSCGEIASFEEIGRFERMMRQSFGTTGRGVDGRYFAALRGMRIHDLAPRTN